MTTSSSRTRSASASVTSLAPMKSCSRIELWPLKRSPFWTGARRQRRPAAAPPSTRPGSTGRRSRPTPRPAGQGRRRRGRQRSGGRGARDLACPAWSGSSPSTTGICRAAGGTGGRRSPSGCGGSRRTSSACRRSSTTAAERNSARWLAEAAGYAGVAYGGAAVEGGGGTTFGNAVLSRWPIDHEATFGLPSGDPRPEPIDRLVLHARTGGHDVFCTHLTSLYECGDLRETAGAPARPHRALGVADPAADLPPIVAGDFNAEPDSTEIRFLTGSTSLDGRSTYYQDAWRVAGGREPGHHLVEREPVRRRRARARPAHRLRVLRLAPRRRPRPDHRLQRGVRPAVGAGRVPERPLRPAGRHRLLTQSAWRWAASL